MKTPTSQSYIVSMALLSAVLFGAATPASKSLLGNLSAFQLAGLLYLGAALGVTVVVLKRGSWRPPWRMSGINRLRLLGAVFFGGIIGPILLLMGLQLASAASVSLWLNLELIATAILGRVLFHDHLGRYGWIGTFGVIAAGALLTADAGIAGIWAGLLVAGACFCWGLDNHFTALIDGITPAQSTFWKGLVAGSVNLAIGIWLAPVTGGAMVIGSALIVGAVCYGASITLYIAAAQGLGATRAQMFFASAPFLGVALSAVTLGESISALQVIAAGVLVISLAFIFRDQHQHEHEHIRQVHEHSHRHDDDHHTHTHSGKDPSHRHSHQHEHEPVRHTHPHWSDLHHRHPHDD